MSAIWPTNQFENDTNVRTIQDMAAEIRRLEAQVAQLEEFIRNQVEASEKWIEDLLADARKAHTEE